MDVLKSKGHNVTVMDIGRVAAVVQAVMRKGDTIYGSLSTDCALPLVGLLIFVFYSCK